MTMINIDSTYGVIVLQDLKVVSVDENYAQIYGYDTAEELLNSIDSFLELIPEEFHETAKQNCLDIIAGKMYPRGQTFTNINRHGEEFTVFSVDHLIQWKGKPALQVTVIDLSVVVEANRKLREKDQMFKRLIMDSGQGILIHRNFKPLMANQALVKTLRADSIEQLLAVESILNLTPEHQHLRVKTHYQNMLKGSVKNSSRIVERICFDGCKRFFNLYENVIEWEDEPAIQVVLEDFTDKVKFEQDLAYRASHDPLTDLLNRSAIYDWLETHFSSKEVMTCILIDIDDFKLINDNYGHQTGDKVITALAAIIKQTVTNVNGVAGRWGGEEFIAFIPNISREQATSIANSIRLAFNQIEPLQKNNPFTIGASFGISSNSTNDASITIEHVIKIADKHLYQAKKNGKNCISICKEYSSINSMK